VGDLVVFEDPNGAVSSDAMVISEIGPSRQHIKCYTVNFNASVTLAYATLTKATDLKIFAPGTNTAEDIVAAVNVIGCPVSAVVVGTGDGVIDSSSWYANTQVDFRYDLRDGINYVANTNEPATQLLPTTFDLKLPVSGDLTTDNDFSNEIFYLVPQTVASVVGWLNTPAITGLWSVAEIASNTNGTKVQIKSKTPGEEGAVFVEGGSANAKTAAVIGSATQSQFNASMYPGMTLTTTKAEAEGLCGNSYVELNNTETLSKVTDSSGIWGSGNSITSITEDGVVTFSGQPYLKRTFVGYGGEAVVFIENIGKYIAVRVYKGFNQDTLTFTSPGGWLSVRPGSGSPSISLSNCGVFRIVNFSQTEAEWVWWIENPDALEEGYVAASLVNIYAESPVPGDVLSIKTDLLGVGNRGDWIISEVGNWYTDNTLTLSTTNQKMVPFSGSVLTEVKNVSIIEGTPIKAVKRLICISPNQDNSDNADLLFDDYLGMLYWQQSAGTVVSSVDKLGFPNTPAYGDDAYRYNHGLVAEAKRVIYGDSADIDNYPGYVSNGAEVLIQGPIVKQIKVTLQVRLRGQNSNTVGNVKSSVAGFINSTPIGVPIPISDIINAASINGVVAVSVISPTYSSVQDRIPLRGQEKALVVNADQDITVIVVGD
jgi:hypothetical protein